MVQDGARGCKTAQEGARCGRVALQPKVVRNCAKLYEIDTKLYRIFTKIEGIRGHWMANALRRRKTLQDRSKSDARAIKSAQDRPKFAQDRPKIPLAALLGHLGAVLGPKMCVFP